MASWTYDPSQYEERSFELIPVGDHRVRIEDVTEKKFKSGNEGYEITMSVSGFKSKLWYYLVLDASNKAQTNQKIGDFFNSFGITGTQMGTGKQWVGKTGAVRVKHEEYNGEMGAKVHYCISRDRQENLPAWKNAARSSATAAVPQAEAQVEIPSDLPFDM